MPVLAPVVAAVSSVLVAAGATAAVATFAAQVIVTIGLAVGSAVLSKLLSPTQKPPGQEFEAKAGANVPGWCVYGRQKLRGQIMPPVQLSDRVVHVHNLGIGWHDALEHIIIDGQRCRIAGIEGQWSNSGAPFVGIGGTAPPSPTPTPQEGDPPYTPGIQASGAGGSAWYETLEFGSNVRIKFYDGRPTQTADSYLTANTQTDAQGNAHWTAAHAGNSVCRVLVEIRPDTNKNLSANPQLEFIVRGRRVWDPRKDPAYGGSGTHSRSDMATWEWSDNVALCATDYRLGLWLNGVKVFGIGTPISRIRIDSRIAAANVCDTPRPLLDDEEEPMWRIAAVVSNERTHRDNLQIFMDAMAGWETERGGAYRLTAGGPQTPVVAIGDGDLAKAPARYRAQKPLSERYNGVEGKFADPFNAYELQDLPLRLSSADEAVDMGERRLLPMTLSQVPSETQAQHLMEIARRRQRLQASATLTLPPRLRDPEIMDTVTWSSAWHGGEAREFQIQNPWRKNRDMTVTWGLVETSAAIWDWDPETDQLSRLVAADLPSAVERINTIAGFAVSANYEEGDDGQRIPIFIVSWTPITDQSVDGILVRYRQVGTTEWAQKRFDTADTLAAGTGKIDSGIQAGTDYEFEADLLTTPPRYTAVVTPAPVTSDPNHVVRRARVTETVVPGGVDWDASRGEVQQLVRDAYALARRNADDLRSLASRVTETLAGAHIVQREEILNLTTTFEQSFAQISQVAGLASDAAGAVATLEGRITTRFGADDSPTRLEAVVATIESAYVNEAEAGAISREEMVARLGVAGEPGSIEAVVSEIGSSYVDEDEAAAIAQAEMSARLGAPGDPGSIEGRVSTIEGVYVTSSGVSALIVSALTARFGAVDDPERIEATVEQIFNVTVGPSGASALWSLQLDVGGRVSGLKNLNNGTTADFIIRADRFGIENPDTDELAFYFDSGTSTLVLEDGTIIAAVIKSVDGRYVIDLQNKLQTIKDSSDNVTLLLGYY